MNDKRINPIFEALSNVDERHIPTSKAKRLAKKLAMGLAAAAAVILAVGGGIIMLTHNRADIGITDDPEIYEYTEEYPTDVEVTCGKYYFNGDINSGLWVEVNPDFLTLKGDDIEAALRGAEGGEVEINYNRMKLLYCAEKDYVIRNFKPDKSEYIIMISRTGERMDDESIKNERGVAGLLYKKAENSIRLGALGDFILVE